MTPPRGTPATLLALLRDAPRQAQDLAEELGIDTSAVRRHLESLRAEGLVSAADEVSGPGRPKKMYAITAAGRETFPRDYALLLDLVLAKVAKKRDRREVESLMRLIAKDLASRVEGRSDPERVRALVALYNELGFDAELEKTVGGVRLRQRNCIFLKTAVGDPALLCECLDEGIMRAALPGATVEFEGSLATGKPRCSHFLRLA